jgi:hypothetical protein
VRSILAGLRTLVLPWGASGSTPRIVAGPTIPATLVAASTDFTWTAAIVKYFNATDYAFDAIGTYNINGVPITASGTYSVATGVLFNMFEQTSSPSGTILFGSSTYNSQSLNWTYRNSTLTTDSTTTLTVAGPFNIPLVTGGLLMNIGGTYVSALTTAAGEVYANRNFTTTLVNGHLYQIKCSGSWKAGIANNQLDVKLRKGITVASTQIAHGHGWGPTSGFTYEFAAESWIIGTGVAVTFGLFAQNLTGGNVDLLEDPLSPTLFAAVDYGPTTNVTPI